MVPYRRQGMGVMLRVVGPTEVVHGVGGVSPSKRNEGRLCFGRGMFWLFCSISSISATIPKCFVVVGGRLNVRSST